MKAFLVLLLVGCVSASFKEDFEKASNEAVKAFKRGLEKATPLHLALGVDNTEELQRFERGVKEDLEAYIKDAFEKTLKKVLQALINGKEVHPEAVKSLLELKEKMKDLNIMGHELDGIKEQIDDHLQKILEQLGILDASYSDIEPLQSMFEDLSFRNFFIRMKEMILEKMDVSNVKQGLSKALGQMSQSLCQWLTNKGQEKVMNFFDRILESDQESEVDKRSVSEDMQERLQDYMQDVNESMMHLQNKLMRFNNWVQNSVIQSLAQAQSHIEEVRTVAKGAVEKSMNTTSAIKKIYEKEE